MLIVDSIRGSDSTGFVTAKGDESTVFKIAGDPYFAKENKTYDRTLMKAANVLIGHNRYATTGKITRLNAHPFDFPNVVGVHNGTLTNKWALPDGHTFDVDSEALYNAIDTLGVAPAIGKALGAWSLVWFNKKQKTINFLRNDERPMSLCFSEDKKTLFFASEAHMLQWILVRNGVKHTPIQITTVNKLISLKLKEEYEAGATPLADFDVEEVLGAPKPVFQQALPVTRNTGSADVINITAAASFLNTSISFYTEGVLHVDGLHYVKGEFYYGNSQKSFKVLINTARDEAFTDYLLDDSEEAGFLTFTGIVSSVRTLYGEQYLVVNKTTVKGETPLKKSEGCLKIQEATPEYPGFEGKALSMIQWRDLTAYGCKACMDYPEAKDAKRLQWISKFEFYCARCAH